MYEYTKDVFSKSKNLFNVVSPRLNGWLAHSVSCTVLWTLAIPLTITFRILFFHIFFAINNSIKAQESLPATSITKQMKTNRIVWMIMTWFSFSVRVFLCENMILDMLLWKKLLWNSCFKTKYLFAKFYHFTIMLKVPKHF